MYAPSACSCFAPWLCLMLCTSNNTESCTTRKAWECVTCQLYAWVTYRQGARFTKWRAALKVSDSLPSSAAIDLNAKQLADYAAISQVLCRLVSHGLHGLQQWTPAALDLAVPGVLNSFDYFDGCHCRVVLPDTSSCYACQHHCTLAVLFFPSSKSLLCDAGMQPCPNC